MSVTKDKPTLQEMLSREYPVYVCHVAEEDTPGYYIAFLPDFGKFACSATGDTMGEAIGRLPEVKKVVFKHYLETGRYIPEPSQPDKAKSEEWSKP